MSSRGSFEIEFQRRVRDIKARAKSSGTNLTQLCASADISRATPIRWETHTPQSVLLVDKLEAELVKIEAKAANRA